jgi:thioredoxin-related protein
MKKIFFSLFFLSIVSVSSTAQDWTVDYEEAKVLSKKTDRPILMVFQGSDWCAPCRKLDKEVWNTEEFKKYAAEHFVLLQVDFPRKKQNRLSDKQEKQNNLLAEKYNRDGGFPLVVILNSEDKVLGRIGYKCVSTSEYIKMINEFL